MSWPRRLMVIAFLGSTSLTIRRQEFLAHAFPISLSSLLPSSCLVLQTSVPLPGNGSAKNSRVGAQACCLSMMSSGANMNGGDRGGRCGGGRCGGGRGHQDTQRKNNSTSNNKRRRRRTRRRLPPPPMPPAGQPGRECFRSCIMIGSDVHVVRKEDQRTDREARGTVSRLLTKSAYHPRGIKVMLESGMVGRVTRINRYAAATASNTRDVVQEMPSNSGNIIIPKKLSLSDYLREEGVDENLVRVVMAAADASSNVANDLRNLSLLADGIAEEGPGDVNVQGEEQKSMDVRANAIFVQKLKPVVATMVSEEVEAIMAGDATTGEAQYEIAFDPLDGSSNLDVAAPTGSIFGIYRRDDDAVNFSPFESYPRRSMVAAGYALYSSSTELILAGLGENVVGFTLDSDDTFRRSRPVVVCPERGPYYSLNEAREPDWPDGLRMWIDDAKGGRTPSGTEYSARYVCSLAADFHRTLLKGGWAGNPRPHLRLLYEAAPLAFIAEKAGGKGSDGVGDLLDVVPDGLHSRVCCFLGSKSDVEDLVAYGDVQQSSKRYDA